MDRKKSIRNLLIVIASQDYDTANHKGLWDEYSKIENEDVLVVNLPADYVVSRLKGKQYRIKEAKKGMVLISDSLKVIRPIFFIRPELLLPINYGMIAKQFWKIIDSNIDLNNYDHINLLIYNPLWVRILSGTRKNVQVCYYLYDEVRYFAHSQKVNKKKAYFDEFACRNSDFIITMTERLKETRQKYNKNIIVFGNGASQCEDKIDSKLKLPQSVGFIGNFRSWIDTELLEALVAEHPEAFFVFAGNIEGEMRVYFDKLLNTYINTAYLGKIDKTNINQVYRMVTCVIVPYKQNDFMQATRPIKIVESIMEGTPVVTVPMSGYQESEFIRFAKNKEEFSDAIMELLNSSLDRNSADYLRFCEENSWRYKAIQLHDILE